MVPVQTQQREHFAIKQEMNPANSQPIYYETPFQEPLRQQINLQTKQAELSSQLVEQQKTKHSASLRTACFLRKCFRLPGVYDGVRHHYFRKRLIE